MESKSAYFDKIINIQNMAVDMQIYQWLHHDMHTFQFWLLIFLFLAPWYVWWKLADKKRLMEILLYGLLVQLLVTVIDEAGCQLNLWEYPIDFEPLFPRMLMANFTLIPVTFMLIYQHFTEWKKFISAHAIQAAVFSFIGEPTLALLDIYVLYKWKFIYSFPIYVIVAVLMKLLTTSIINGQRAAAARTPGKDK